MRDVHQVVVHDMQIVDAIDFGLCDVCRSSAERIWVEKCFLGSRKLPAYFSGNFFSDFSRESFSLVSPAFHAPPKI